MPTCKIPLSNIGNGDCPLQMDEIRRVLLVTKRKENNTLNSVSVTNAASLSAWQTLFNKPDFSSSLFEKVVPSPYLYKFVSEQGDPTVYDEDGDYEKLRDGNYDIMAELHKVRPEIIKQLKTFEDNEICAYLVDKGNRVWGRKDGSTLYPIELVGFNVQNFMLKTAESTSIQTLRARIKFPEQMNDLYSVVIASADVTDDNDFYSLIDASQTITLPATTGCKTVIATDRYSEVVTDITYTGFVFRNVATGVASVVSGADKLTETPDGTYVINQTALLTSGQVYDLEVFFAGYNIAVGTVTVP